MPLSSAQERRLPFPIPKSNRTITARIAGNCKRIFLHFPVSRPKTTACWQPFTTWHWKRCCSTSVRTVPSWQVRCGPIHGRVTRCTAFISLMPGYCRRFRARHWKNKPCRIRKKPCRIPVAAVPGPSLPTALSGQWRLGNIICTRAIRVGWNRCTMG